VEIRLMSNLDRRKAFKPQTSLSEMTGFVSELMKPKNHTISVC